MNHMLPSLRVFMTLLICQIVVSGCISESVEDELINENECFDSFLLENQSAVQQNEKQGVVANVRAHNLFNKNTN